MRTAAILFLALFTTASAARAQYRSVQRYEARQGLLLSFGAGGGSLNVTPDGRIGAFDLDFRLGYGFSDRFQLFGDVTLDTGTYAGGGDTSSWTTTLRAQTVLIGDRSGNGLNLNAGIGLGGVSKTSANDPYSSASSPAGLALAGGVSYDARISRYFALEPEFFGTWHAIPNRPGLANDVATVWGLRLNFLWVLH